MKCSWIAIAPLIFLLSCQPTTTTDATDDTEEVSGEDLTAEERLALFAAIARNSSQGALVDGIEYADGKTDEVQVFFEESNWRRINTDDRVALAGDLQKAWAGIYSAESPEDARIKIIVQKLNGEFIPVGGSKSDGDGDELFMTPRR